MSAEEREGWSWADIQARAVAAGADDWSTCPACSLRVLQRVGTLHVTEEHPEIAASLRAVSGEVS